MCLTHLSTLLLLLLPVAVVNAVETLRLADGTVQVDIDPATARYNVSTSAGVRLRGLQYTLTLDGKTHTSGQPGDGGLGLSGPGRAQREHKHTHTHHTHTAHTTHMRARTHTHTHTHTHVRARTHTNTACNWPMIR